MKQKICRFWASKAVLLNEVTIKHVNKQEMMCCSVDDACLGIQGVWTTPSIA